MTTVLKAIGPLVPELRRLPALPAESASEDSADVLTGSIASLGRPLRVLLAEDNPTNQLVCRQMLRDFDIDLSTAPNGAEAVGAVSAFAYDVVLMDIQMPEMNGIQATREIRARFGSDLPIIALTANVYPEVAKACLDAGMNGFVAKPLRKRALVEAIVAAVKGAPATTFVIVPASEPRADEAPIIDPEAIDEFIAEVGAEATAELLKTYLSETERRLAILRNLSVDQPDAIHLEAHTLKGSRGIFGLPRLAGTARMLERSAATLTTQDYRVRLEELDAAYAESKDQLVAYLEKVLEGVALAG